MNTEYGFHPTVGVEWNNWRIGLGASRCRECLYPLCVRVYLGPATVFLRWRDRDWREPEGFFDD